MTAIQLAQRATGLLRTFNVAGVLSAADVHVAVRLGRLGREDSELALFAAALAVRAVRSGSVCLELQRMHEIGVDGEGFDVEVDPEVVDPATLPWPGVDEVVAALRASPLICGSDAGPLRPLRLVDHASGPLLYLDRYYRQEQVIRETLTERAATHPLIDPETVRRQLDRLFPGTGPGDLLDRQRVAAALAATHWTTVVAGGPGTGKTHTIARILALLVAHQASSPGAPALRIAMAAPTGKAAARLQESVREQAGALDLPELTAATLHRLLGWQRGGVGRFRHHEHNRLPYDVIVVDETSMVSLTMMSRLLPAVRPDARLVLVGDPDQLASVDAGAVLADLVAGPIAAQPNPVLAEVLGGERGWERGGDETAAEDSHPGALSVRERDRLRGGIIRLTRGRRFGGRIAELAVAVRAGDADTALALLSDGGDELSLCGPDDAGASRAGMDTAAVRADVVRAAGACTAAAERGDAAAALAAMESHRLLCAHRQGQYGVERWDRQAAGWVAAAGLGAEPGAGHWFPGQPLLITANDHEARIYNGDTGVIVRAEDGGLRAALQRGSEPYLVHPTQFPGVTTVYAMTIHRSQGSQYGTVSVVLPGPESTLLTRELLYTAITRARSHVRIIGTQEAIRAGIDRRVLRASGLRG